MKDAQEKAESKEGILQRRWKELEDRAWADKREILRLRVMLGEAEARTTKEREKAEVIKSGGNNKQYRDELMRPSYRTLVDRVGAALPCLTREQCLRGVMAVRARHSGSLSGLTVPYIIREVARGVPLPTEGEADPIAACGAKTDEATRRAVGSVIGERARPRQTATSAGDAAAEDAKECCICLDSLDSACFPDEVTCLVPCQHKFHSGCIRDWFKEKRDCPLCRKFTILHDEYPTLR